MYVMISKLKNKIIHIKNLICVHLYVYVHIYRKMTGKLSSEKNYKLKTVLSKRMFSLLLCLCPLPTHTGAPVGMSSTDQLP